MIITESGQLPAARGPAEWFTGEVWIETIAEEPLRLRASRVFFAPGARTAWHSHPSGQTLLVVEGVLSGSIRFEIEGQAPTRLHTGDAFFEPRDAPVLRFDNAAADEPAVSVACYLLGPGATETITMDLA